MYISLTLFSRIPDVFFGNVCVTVRFLVYTPWYKYPYHFSDNHSIILCSEFTTNIDNEEWIGPRWI